MPQRGKDYPPGWRAPGSDLIVRRTVGFRKFNQHEQGQEIETICIRAREDKGGEPCGNLRTVLAKRLIGRRGVKACEDCARHAKRGGRPSTEKTGPKADLRAQILNVTSKTFREIRERLKAEGGPRWAEFEDYRERRAGHWNVRLEIEAIQVVLCSPASGLCCYKHESGENDAPDDTNDNETASFWRELLQDESERNSK